LLFDRNGVLFGRDFFRNIRVIGGGLAGRLLHFRLGILGGLGLALLLSRLAFGSGDRIDDHEDEVFFGRSRDSGQAKIFGNVLELSNLGILQ
jgi:hypothetical protein